MPETTTWNQTVQGEKKPFQRKAKVRDRETESFWHHFSPQIDPARLSMLSHYSTVLERDTGTSWHWNVPLPVLLLFSLLPVDTGLPLMSHSNPLLIQAVIIHLVSYSNGNNYNDSSLCMMLDFGYVYTCMYAICAYTYMWIYVSFKIYMFVCIWVKSYIYTITYMYIIIIHVYIIHI